MPPQETPAVMLQEHQRPPLESSEMTKKPADDEKREAVNTTHQSRRRSSTLKERSKIPPSMALIAILFFGLQYCGGIYSKDVVLSALRSFQTSWTLAHGRLVYFRDLMQDLLATMTSSSSETTTTYHHPSEYVSAFLVASVLACIFYVLIWSPLRAGMWTSPRRVGKHMIHRYMGLCYLTLYTTVWIEYLTNYEEGKNSFLPHFVATNGLIQGLSAYFSFKVLPDLIDAGYYSDKAVLSRTFVHENLYFSLLAYVGTGMYNDIIRENLYQTVLGKIIMYTFVFFPYILVRPWFPTTQFSKAGSGTKSRSHTNERFYEIGTTMVKIFYLWAKYFCGFYINFLIFLGLQTESDMKFIRGLFLLNMGTVSIAIFLHTLRFKKVLPPKLTFSLYLAQIYASFSAIPMAYDMFAAHKRLCFACLTGILANMTRSRPIHGIW
eukprot:CAMPEP_0194029930 /NCGR_PEP_ID=MMETSP0009_2-20130614/3551_1 /TAXON_ID=210454 /ORGANISM="Grammatophora oceanica, Strain CCMP 410" /LENGTH=435 /DNA_ID=CAMNT_0038669753 /DNA_START=100 /DNA_END=1404 /DNA_ORIENTATION=+